jgi:hypothetical protein
MARHPEVAVKRGIDLNNNRTPEFEAKRTAASSATYAAMTSEDKQKFSDHTSELWQRDDLMHIARSKAAETYKQRYSNGDYDFTERNKKLSDVITQKYLDGGFEWARGKYLSTKTNKECCYRSSWELTLMQQLDSDHDVLDWESEFTSIPYMFEGTEHKYIPDLHVIQSSGHSLIEVKPQALRDLPKNAAKREAAKEFCDRNNWKYVEWSPANDLQSHDDGL